MFGGLPNDLQVSVILTNNNEYSNKLPNVCYTDKENMELCKKLNLYKEKCIKRGWLKDDTDTLYKWLSSNQLAPENELNDDWENYFKLRQECVLTNNKIKELIENNLFSGKKDAVELWKKIPIEYWDTSGVTDMYQLFMGNTNFNHDIGNWNVSNVENMSRMFEGATEFNQPIGRWDVSNVKYMDSMFKGAISFNQPIGNWNVSNVRSMSRMFEDANSMEEENKPF